MPLFLSELMCRASGALAVAVLTVGAAPAAYAALQGRDLDATHAGFEAYYDTDLNITWLADANYAKTSGYAAANSDGGLTWDAAKTWAAQLNVGGITGWRLPDVKPVNGSSFQYIYSPAGNRDIGGNIVSTQSELSHLYYVTLGNKGAYSASNVYQPDSGLKNAGPFINVQPSSYWSGVAYALSTDSAWYFDAGVGFQGGGGKALEFSAWAVRSGDVAAVPEPQTYALELIGLAAVLMASERRHR